MFVFPPAKQWMKEARSGLVKAAVVVIALGILLVVLSEVVSLSWLGRWDAERDMARGEYALSMPRFYATPEIVEQARAQYGVTLKGNLGVCLMFGMERTYRAGYSKAVRAVLDRRFGKDAQRALWKNAWAAKKGEFARK